MENTRAGEIMVPLDRYPHIPYWFSIRQAVAEMETAEIDVKGRKSIPRVVLVFDEAYRLMGFVRRRDILRGLLPSFLSEGASEGGQSPMMAPVDPNLSEVFSDEETVELRDLSDKPISSIMNPIVRTVDYNDHLLKLVHDIVVNNYYMLPVMRDSKVAGVVRSIDVLHHVAKLIL